MKNKLKFALSTVLFFVLLTGCASNNVNGYDDTIPEIPTAHISDGEADEEENEGASEENYGLPFDPIEYHYIDRPEIEPVLYYICDPPLNEEQEEEPEDEEELEEEQECEEEPEHEPYFSGLVWIVEPTLNYEFIQLCNCGMFREENWLIVDPVTGLLTGQEHFGHGGPGPEFVFDRERNLFGHPGRHDGYREFIGMMPMHEFEAMAQEWDLQVTSGLIGVENVDSSLQRDLSGYNYGYDDPDFMADWWALLEEAHTGQFAVMYNRRLITDFIFSDAAPWWYGFTFDEGGHSRREFISVRLGDYWGLLDSNGDVVLDFMFESLVIIDDNTAFARYGGRYGILDYRSIVN